MGKEEKAKKSKATSAAGIVVRCIVCLISAVMIVWYLDSRLISFGSIVGIAFFITAALCALFFPQLCTFILKMRKSLAGRIASDAVIALAALFVLWCAGSVTAMCIYADRPASENATVVVLGCQVRDGRPSYMLSLRLDSAYTYLTEHPQSKCVLSGGQGDNEAISEAQCMYEYLTEKGIDPGRLYLEDRSSTTEENLRFTMQVIKKESLEQEIVIVTDWYHELRANLIASRQGIKAGCVGGPTPMFLTANLVTREIFALANELVFG